MFDTDFVLKNINIPVSYTHLTTKNVTIVSVDDGKKYSGFTGLTYHTSKETAVIPEDGALVTYKLAKDFNLKENDNVSVTIDDRTYEFKIAGIVRCV